MKTVDQILGEQGISLRIAALGNHKTTCSRCSASRKKKREPCLSVRISEEGVQWRCHNDGCGYQGGEFYDGHAERRASEMARGARVQSGNSDSLRALHRSAKLGWARSRHRLSARR